MSTIALVCPGRGSYTEKSLGSLPRDHELVLAADRIRAELDLESVYDLDGAERFEPARHLRPANVSALIYLVSMLDGLGARAEHETVCVIGNSMGWYTALALAGALSFEDGFRLVQHMALIQEQVGGGGQVLYPVVDDDWRPDPERKAAIEAVLAQDAGHTREVFPSIDLGGYRVLAGTPAGVSRLLAELPKVKLGKTAYPFKLAQHGPYHTPLVGEVTRIARERLAGLEFRRPDCTLVDGRGRRHAPVTATPKGLRDYTLGAQVDTPYDFTASVRVALCEEAPHRLVLPGPGNTLGGVCGQILAHLGWRGIRSKADFERVQAGDEPIVDSLRRG